MNAYIDEIIFFKDRYHFFLLFFVGNQTTPYEKDELH